MSTVQKWEACGNLVRTARNADGSGGFLVAECPVNTGYASEHAHLIAAAPSLRMVLARLLDVCVRMEAENEATRPTEDEYQEAITAGRAALVSATGHTTTSPSPLTASGWTAQEDEDFRALAERQRTQKQADEAAWRL